MREAAEKLVRGVVGGERCGGTQGVPQSRNVCNGSTNSSTSRNTIR